MIWIGFFGIYGGVGEKYVSRWSLVSSLFVIDRDGFICYSHLGYVDSSTLIEEINRVI